MAARADAPVTLSAAVATGAFIEDDVGGVGQGGCEAASDLPALPADMAVAWDLGVKQAGAVWPRLASGVWRLASGVWRLAPGPSINSRSSPLT